MQVRQMELPVMIDLSKVPKPPEGACAPELAEHFLLADWLKIRGVKFFHPANGEYRTPQAGRRLKRMGVSPGIVDIVIPLPRNGFCGLWIELKRKYGGIISPEQREWIDWLNANGHLAVVAKGADEAMRIVEKYMGW